MFFGLHTKGFAGVAFQVCTTDANIYIKFLKYDVVIFRRQRREPRERRQIKTAISYATRDFWFKRGLKRSMK